MRLSTNTVQQLGINAMLDQQSNLAHTQQQLALGQRIVTPADDPVAATLALGLDQIKNNNDGYTQNANYAQSRLQLEDTTLSSAQTNLQRMRELVVNGLNGTMGAADRKDIAAELSQRYDQMLTLANTADGSGNFIFAGENNTSAPFTGNLSAGVAYGGGQAQQHLQISASRQIAVTDSGTDVFSAIPTAVSATGAGNTGTATASNVSASGALPIGGSNGSTGQLTLTYNAATKSYAVALSGSSRTLSTTSVAFDPATDQGKSLTLRFTDGSSVSVDVKGTPNTGDTVTISDQKQDAFTILGKAVKDMQNGTPDSASLDQIDALMSRISDIRAKVGGRLNAVTEQQDANANYNTQLAKTKSDLTDLDYASAVGKMNTQLTGLQAAQKSYMKVQGLSLFNYL